MKRVLIFAGILCITGFALTGCYKDVILPDATVDPDAPPQAVSFKNDTMKLRINIPVLRRTIPWLLVSWLLVFQLDAFAQDSTATAAVSETSASIAPAAAKHKKIKALKNSFKSIWIMDNQTVLVPP